MKHLSTLFICLIINITVFGQMIINHTNTDITKLSLNEINQAKKTLHIFYAHTSHGSQVTEGMDGLVSFANGGGKGLSLPQNIFAYNNGGNDNALDLDDHYADLGDVGYFPDWYINTVSYLNNADHSDVNVVMWSWCGQVDDKYALGTLYSQYLQPMQLLEQIYPNVKFVYMTGHLDIWDNANNMLANDSIRNFCKRNKKILFDFNDIERYNPDGAFFEYASDDCSYYNSEFNRLGNWAEEWRNKHTENVDWYYCGSAHSDPLNANQKAYAAWNLFTKIAKLMNPVQPKLQISDTTIHSGSTVCFNAKDSLTITGSVDSVLFEKGSSVTLIAGKSIMFLPGFHAKDGCWMNASITTDSTFCDGKLGSIVQSPVAEKSANLDNNSSNLNKGEVQGQVKIYPNPNNGIFTIELEEVGMVHDIEIYNSLGRLVYDSPVISNNHCQVDLTGMEKGLYFIKILNGDKRITRKIMVD